MKSSDCIGPGKGIKDGNRINSLNLRGCGDKKVNIQKAQKYITSTCKRHKRLKHIFRTFHKGCQVPGIQHEQVVKHAYSNVSSARLFLHKSRLTFLICRFM